ncbi:hypothetical protein OQ620_27415, partial [Klebsiella pneumoniae]|nr:hypothetical protein [Klebsiella pneumoniae]
CCNVLGFAFMEKEERVERLVEA